MAINVILVTFRLSNLVAQNSTDTLMLGCELLTESGHDFNMAAN